jgi:hypothetical protein
MFAAASSKVIVTLLFAAPLGAPTLEPASETNINFLPSGETSRTSISPGDVCVTLFNVTVMADVVPERPLTVMLDGYGDAAPDDGMVIAVALVKTVWTSKWSVPRTEPAAAAEGESVFPKTTSPRKEKTEIQSATTLMAKRHRQKLVEGMGLLIFQIVKGRRYTFQGGNRDV